MLPSLMKPNLKIIALLAGALNTTCALAWIVTPGEREFTVATAKLSVVVRDGAMIELRDLASGQLWADRRTADTNTPTGLGLLYDLENFRKGHIPWGEPSLKQNLEIDFPLLNYFRPDEKSQYKLTQEEKTLTATWRGLSNGKVSYPKAELILKMSENADGSLSYQVSGSHAEGMVFSAGCPLVNIDKQVEMVVPSFGGMAYRNDGSTGLIPLGGAPFIDAPLLMAQKEGKSLAIWMEDPTMRSFYAFLRRSTKSFSLGMEVMTLMPFETQKTVSTPVFTLQVFDGDWKTAATPYRDWYQAYFKDDIAVRDGVPWVKDIKAIIDIYMTVPNEESLARIAKIFPKKSVLFQIWNARAPDFDTQLPDWTPREGYTEGVKRIHDSGFKAMAYVNTYCASYQSPVWKRDRLSDFALTRKNGFWTYKGKSVADTKAPINEKLIGTVDYSDGPDQFAEIPEGRLLYTDPLSARWRQYHADMMKVWNETTGTDANYEDTAGCVADGGNGIVDGLSAGEGSIAAMRLLQKTQPKVAMSSEYGPSGIAFGTSWALNYAGHWGMDGFKQYRINNQYPVSTYLFGYRQWISGMLSSNDLRCHTMEATSDSTGGLGFSMVDYFLRKEESAIDANFDWPGHLYRRALAFAKEELEPYFPEGNYPPFVRCFYKGTRGIFTYQDDGKLQQLLDPKGEPLYGRAFHATKITTSLWLDNWPLQNGREIYGLDPKAHYPLFVKPPNAKACALTIEQVPDKVALKKYYDSPSHAYLELEALPGGPREISLTFQSSIKYAHYSANDQPVTPGTITATLPLRLVAVTPAADLPPGSPIGSVPPNVELRGARGQTLYVQNGKDVHSDYAIHVPAEEAALELYLQNLQEKYPYHGFDGSIVRVLVNGRELKSFDCLASTKEKPDTFLRRWQIPLAEYAGKDVLVTVSTDFKENPIQDRQFISVPTLVQTTGTGIQEKVYDGSFKVVKNVSTPDKWDGGKISEPGEGKMIDGTGIRVSSGAFAVDPAKTYRLSGKFKASAPWTQGNLLFGLAPLDGSSKPIFSNYVNPVKETETTLAKDAAAGDTVLTIANSSKWKNNDHVLIAFQAKEGLADLPNAAVASIVKVENNEVTLKEPLKTSYAAGTPVRQHESGNSYMYSGAAYEKVPADKWTEFSGEISGESASGLSAAQWWKGTKMARILLLASQPDIQFKDIRLDEIE